jgi:hypothetical protein
VGGVFGGGAFGAGFALGGGGSGGFGNGVGAVGRLLVFEEQRRPGVA